MHKPYSYLAVKTSRFQSYNIHHLLLEGDVIYIYTGMSTKDVQTTVDGMNGAYQLGFMRGEAMAKEAKNDPLPDESTLVV